MKTYYLEEVSTGDPFFWTGPTELVLGQFVEFNNRIGVYVVLRIYT